ncbi:MAG: hypothetical protein AAGJ56_09325 [Myxococcota bacterium]
MDTRIHPNVVNPNVDPGAEATTAEQSRETGEPVRDAGGPPGGVQPGDRYQQGGRAATSTGRTAAAVELQAPSFRGVPTAGIGGLRDIFEDLTGHSSSMGGQAARNLSNAVESGDDAFDARRDAQNLLRRQRDLDAAVDGFNTEAAQLGLNYEASIDRYGNANISEK